jgi:EmrB/QacA subfamily drug resistance transporter
MRSSADVSSEPHYVTGGHVRLTRQQLTGTLAGLLLSLLLAAIDQTIVGTAMPRVISELNGFDRYPWVTTAYLLTSTIAVPVFAKLSDLYGRKRFFLAGCLLFTITSGLCGASGQLAGLPLDGMNQLIVFRGLQGVGAGMIVGLLFAIIGDIFAPLERGKYQGLFAAVWGMASIFGPTLGGWITDTLSWRWTFYVNLPVGAIAVAAIWLAFPDFHPQGISRKIDWGGVATLTAGLVPLLLALTWVTEHGWGAPRVYGLLLFAAAMLAAFLAIEARAAEPLLPLTLFRNPLIAICSVAMFVLGMGMFGVVVYLPLFMQGVLDISPTRSGTLLTPMMMAAVGGSVFAGQYTSRAGRYKPLAVGGSALVLVGMVLLAMMNAQTTNLDVLRNMVILGIGLGAMQPVYTLAVQNAAPREQMGAATASTQFFRSIGSTVGVAIFGSVMLSLYKKGFAAAAPPGLPAAALKPFENPLVVVQIRPRLEEAFGRFPGGAEVLHKLIDNMHNALVQALQVIFWVGAGVMVFTVLLNLLMREIPLRGSAAVPPRPEYVD